MRRIERLINLIAALLETRRPLTAEEIRERIAGYDQPNQEAFRRAFERDKEALRAMGVPVELRSTGVAGLDADGYIIPKDKYYLPELNLAPEELAALRLTAEALVGGGNVAESGLMKLSIDAPSATWAGPRVVWGADVAAEQPLLGPLYEALLQRRPVTFGYVAASGDAGSRTVEPYGLVHRGGHWYLVGRDPSRDAVRSFKVSRMSGTIRAEDGTFEVPDSFDAQQHLAREPWQFGDGSDATAVVRFEPAMRWWADQNLEGLSRRVVADGAVEVELPVANPDAFVSWIIGFGDSVEVVSPPDLRARLVDHVRSSASGLA